MRNRVAIVIAVMVLANLACFAQYKASALSADVPVTQTPTQTETMPISTATPWTIMVNTGETWNIRDTASNVVGVAYGGDVLTVVSVTGNWYEIEGERFIHEGCCNGR
jgi:hypothetical protein